MAATEPKEANKNSKRTKRECIIHENLGTIKFPDGSTESAMLEMCGYTDTETRKYVYEVVFTKGEKKYVLVDKTKYFTALDILDGARKVYYFGCALGFTNGINNSSCPM